MVLLAYRHLVDPRRASAARGTTARRPPSGPAPGPSRFQGRHEQVGEKNGGRLVVGINHAGIVAEEHGTVVTEPGGRRLYVDPAVFHHLGSPEVPEVAELDLL